MRKVFVLAVVLLALVGCTPQVPDQSGNCTGICNSDFNFGNPNGPTASPSPGTGGSLPAGSTVRVGLFGQSCPAGTTAPNNGLRQIIQGCVGFLTATPKDPQGNDLTPAVHGPNCAWSSSGSITLTEAGNPFNRDGRCPTVGDSTVSATVKDVSGSVGIACLPGPARSSSAHERVYFWGPDESTHEQRHDAMLRDSARYPGAEVSASNCSNCHIFDPDGPPGLTCHTCQ